MRFEYLHRRQPLIKLSHSPAYPIDSSYATAYIHQYSNCSDYPYYSMLIAIDQHKYWCESHARYAIVIDSVWVCVLNDSSSRYHSARTQIGIKKKMNRKWTRRNELHNSRQCTNQCVGQWMNTKQIMNSHNSDILIADWKECPTLLSIYAFLLISAYQYHTTQIITKQRVWATTTATTATIPSKNNCFLCVISIFVYL